MRFRPSLHLLQNHMASGEQSRWERHKAPIMGADNQDNQGFRPLDTLPISRKMSNRFSCDAGQSKPEGGAFSRSALHPDFSLVLRDQRLIDIEAQAQPFPRTTQHGYGIARTRTRR